MFYVTNGKLRYGVADRNMLSPFLANGYVIEEEKAQVIQPVIENKVEPVIEEVVASEYTKTDINRMGIDDLKKLAKASGIRVKPNDTGAYLKKILIETLIK